MERPAHAASAGCRSRTSTAPVVHILALMLDMGKMGEWSQFRKVGSCPVEPGAMPDQASRWRVASGITSRRRACRTNSRAGAYAGADQVSRLTELGPAARR
jgi:hypothetical protein